MDPLLFALPKGRLQDVLLELIGRAGIGVDLSGVSRRLTFPDREGRFAFVSLKPADVPVYVESGAADVGVAGSDVLREFEPDVYEPLDLRIGICRLVLAVPANRELSEGGHWRIATKYPRTAARFFAERNSHVHIVKLEGSVEIAPQLGLADAIVDLVETGRTLKDNGLTVTEEVGLVSAKLIVNRTAMKTKREAVQRLIADLDGVIYANH
jgi:ATP phosphoribosyltransferase